MQGLIRELKRAVGKTHKDEKCCLYLIVPFLSSNAENYIESFNKLTIIQGLGNLQNHLISTERKIVAMKDRFPFEETKQLADIDAYEYGGDSEFRLRHFIDYERGRYEPTCCLTLTEWKVPDEKSLPESVKKGPEDEMFITQHRVPYKKPKI